ncbi:hypothetical protein E1A91_D10G160700v1 [Gossypium mustelinum]|uniref:Protein kinase domain-containing protein n=1 Tax=Gossypium mustelinum TaxID=34275 RepID=A0A5D2T7G4_GOSMU|nr:hypothetical protein E1A91_D10G160700v1 [Gossypium mustelinum]
MKVNRLCFILPADFNEIAPLGYPPVEKPVKKEGKKHPYRDCGAHFVGFIGDSLRRFYGSRCLLHCANPRRQQSSVFHDLEGVQMSEKVGGDNPRIFSYAELYIGSKGFCQDEILGSGGFGRVYKAVLPSDGTVVAVKCLAEKGERFEKTFAAELVAVAHLRHRNLVRLRGWCVHEDQLLLVYDYMPNRSLDRVLFRRPENTGAPPLNWDRRRKIVRGLAAALFYLHEQLETQIIHRDVKTSNVMLDSQYNARLGDFGLARWLEHELEYQIRTPATKRHQFRLVDTTRIGGTIGYLPPESFQKRSVATTKSDVFSFGVVVLEVVSGRRAVDLTFPDEQIILLDWIRRLSDEDKLLQAGDSQLIDGSYKLADMERFLHIGLLCTLHNPLLRPNMKWVVEVLSGNISGKLPTLPSFESHPLYISLSSSSNTSGSKSTASSRLSTATATTSSVNITVSFASSDYVTATEETIYETAEFGVNGSNLSTSSSRRPTNFFMVDTPREIPFKELIVATDNFAESRRVAELDFGTAYQGFLDNRHHILVKRLGMTKCPALRTRFSSELQNLARLRHRNLVQLRGWCTEQGEMLVVYDYSANQLLSHLLFHHNNITGSSILQWRHRYNIIKSLASAILYLHEEWDEQVIHRNITSSAIILDPDMNPRLSSFALAEFLTRNDHGHHAATNKNKSVRGIFGYMSPEYIESGEATAMADVYSFGVVVLEVVSGYMAADFRQPEVLLVKRVHNFETRKRPFEELVDIRLKEEYNTEEFLRLTKLGIACTRSDPKLRPTIRQIVSILDGNDKSFMEEWQRKEGSEEWKERNAYSLSLVRRIHALGLH